jgi:hypothetical protein
METGHLPNWTTNTCDALFSSRISEATRNMLFVKTLLNIFLVEMFSWWGKESCIFPQAQKLA